MKEGGVGGQKVRYVPRNPGKPNFLAGYPGILAGRPKSLRKKIVFNFWLPKRRFFKVEVQFNRKDCSGSSFGSWKTVPAVPVPLSVSGRTVPVVPVFRFGS